MTSNKPGATPLPVSFFPEDPQLGTRMASLPLLPLATRMQLARDASKSQDMGWLLALERYGEYDFNRSSNAAASTWFHISEDPFVASLAGIVDSCKIKEIRFDIYSGDRFADGGEVALTRTQVENPFFEFFQRRIRVFVSEAQETLAALQQVADQSPGATLATSRFELAKVQTKAGATAGVLMSAAAAINDSQSVRLLGQAFPQACKVAVSGQILGSSRSSEALPTVTAAAVALWFGHREALDALHQTGWRPSYMVSNPVGINAVRMTSPVNAVAWTARSVTEHDLFTFPSVIERLLEMANSEELDEAAGIRSRCDQEALGLAVMAQKELLPLLGVLERCGVLDIDPNKLAVKACELRNVKALAPLLGRIKWSMWSEEVTPSFRLDLSKFPPVVMAQASSRGCFELDDVDPEVAKVCDACIEAGYGHLLAMSESLNAPVRVMATYDLCRALALCLEQGADPTISLRSIHSSWVSKEESTAVELASYHDGADRVMNSHLARVAARSAIEEMARPAGPA